VVVDYLMGLDNPYAAAEHLKKVLKQIKSVAAAAEREAIDVRLAEAQLAAGNSRTASKSFARLSQEAVEPEVRGRALVGLVRAERERGRGQTSQLALERLRQEFPALVSQATD
jgi:thioredoxin-like negative regulator of GroEL